MSEAFQLEQPEKVVPEVGIHEGIPNEVYHHRWEAVNASRLSDLTRSPAHCLWRMVHPSTEQTPAMVFGTAVHCAVLEPEEFEKRYRHDPPCPPERKPSGWKNTNDYKSQAADLRLAGFELLTSDQLEGCKLIRESIYGEPSAARDLLEAMTATEVSYVADDPATGLRCKVRPDLLAESAGIVGDLKTTRAGAKSAFGRQIYSLGYHRSKAFYMDCMETLEPRKWEHHVFLVVENTPPYEVAVYDLDPAATEMGRREVRLLLDLYAECKRTGNWPGYDTTVQTVGVPHWAYYQEEEAS